MKPTMPTTALAATLLAALLLAGCGGPPRAPAAVPAAEAARAAISVGMTMAEVERRLGKPARVRTWGTTKQAQWLYPTGITDEWFAVEFNAGGLVESARDRHLPSF
jgi:outer membrane protein assembly factor BamE (lipoprotein component of BamABCDE complex)